MTGHALLSASSKGATPVSVGTTDLLGNTDTLLMSFLED